MQDPVGIIVINRVSRDVLALGDGHVVLSALMCNVLGGVLVDLERGVIGERLVECCRRSCRLSNAALAIGRDDGMSGDD